MSLGIPYDSDTGPRLGRRHHGRHVRPGVPDQRAHRRSRRARSPGYARNEEPFLEVIRMHRDAADTHRPTQRAGAAVRGARRQCWDEAYESGPRAGYRNAQVTVIAPTGTIGFMMDCDTTGIEPDLALVKYKKLVGGGVIKIVNNTVPQALIKLGYTPEQVEQDRQPHRRHRHHRRRAGPEAGAPAGVRLQLPAAERRRAPSTTWATCG